MTKEDWTEQFEGILWLSKKEILAHAGTILRTMKNIWCIFMRMAYIQVERCLL